jgi:hypothetical protein
MKLKLTILALLSLITAVIAGDAEMKQQLVGTWKDADTRTTIVLKSDGTRLVSGNDFSWETLFHLREMGCEGW